MKRVFLGGNSKGVIWAIVDDDDWKLVAQFNWSINTNGYALTTSKDSNGMRIKYMHHLILGMPPKGLVTHHVNGNKLDNRKANLEIVTNRKNIMLGKAFRGKPHREGKWFRINLSFPTLQEAQEAMNRHYEKYHADYQHPDDRLKEPKRRRF